MNDCTIQITMSAGDINYAGMTIPALAQLHKNQAKEIIAVVDCCRPQRTRLMDPDKALPEPQFSQRVNKIIEIANRLKDAGHLNKVYILRNDEKLIGHLRRKYLANLVQGTHDFRGFGLMSYFFGIEITSTRYVAHYDADMLLYQKPGYDWIAECIKRMSELPSAVTGVPRVAPFSLEADSKLGLPSFHEGVPTPKTAGGWKNDWFNTQCFLVDRKKFDKTLPLIKGKTFFQHLIFHYIMKTTPKSPEMLMRRRLQSLKKFKFISDSPDAWILHPPIKPKEYLDMLPSIIECVRRGIVPKEQEGYGNVIIPAWQEYLNVRPES